MARNENPPFPRGMTHGITDSSDTTSGKQYEGAEYQFEDIDYSNAANVKPARTELPVVTRVVRNKSGFAVLAKRVVTLKTTNHGQIEGYCDVTAEGPCVVVDEHLPSAGCPDNDLCHVVVQGPSLVTTNLAGDATGTIPAGARVVAATAVTSGATTAGRVGVQVLTGATTTADYAFLADQIQNALGVALSTKASTQTAADLLISVRRF